MSATERRDSIARRVDRHTVLAGVAGALSQRRDPRMDTECHRGLDRRLVAALVVAGSDVDVVAASGGGAAVVLGGECSNL